MSPRRCHPPSPSPVSPAHTHYFAYVAQGASLFAFTVFHLVRRGNDDFFHHNYVLLLPFTVFNAGGRDNGIRERHHRPQGGTKSALVTAGSSWRGVGRARRGRGQGRAPSLSEHPILHIPAHIRASQGKPSHGNPQKRGVGTPRWGLGTPRWGLTSCGWSGRAAAPPERHQH